MISINILKMVKMMMFLDDVYVDYILSIKFPWSIVGDLIVS